MHDDEMTDGSELCGEPAGIATIESYETDDGIVFYDAENPLAWVETNRSFLLEDAA